MRNPGQPLSFLGEEMICKHCGEAIHKTPIGWTHDYESGVYCPSKTKAEPLFKRIVPLVNPLRIPIDWWGIAMDRYTNWGCCLWAPKVRHETWVSTGVWLNIKIDFECDTWEESAFSRAEIQERWEQEYGSDWLSKAMEDAG